MSNASDFVIENGVLTKYVGPGGDVVIPEGVKEIRDWAFKIRNDITSVCIPLGVKRIRKYAFFRCSQLSSVNFPDGLETISAGAFEECSSLQFLEISNSVTFIGTMAFANCGMEKVSMPLRTKDDGFRPQGVFFGCKNLRSVSFTTDVDPNYLPLVLSQRSTFDECPLEAIYAPQCPISSMSHYKSYAAAGYAEMVLDGKEIEPEIAITYDRYLKSQRKKLCSFAIVHLPLLRLMLGHKLYSNQEAADCLELALQNGASEAAAVLLEYQRGFTASEKALEENQEIAKALSVPSELELLKSIWTTVLNEDGICVNMYKGAQTEVTIPDKIGRNIVTEIGEFALSPRKKRRSAEQIESCTNIQSVHVGENVKTINDGAFAGCSNLSSLIFRGPLPQIGTSVFSGCTALADADGFIIIDHILFGYVGNDEHVQIPTGVLAIGGAFADQTAICSVSISDTVTEVKNYAFAGCKKLKELIIPANVEVFCYHAIAHCTKLKKLVFRSAKTRVISGVYWPGNIKPTIYAPKGSFAETYAKENKIPFVAE